MVCVANTDKTSTLSSRSSTSEGTRKSEITSMAMVNGDEFTCFVCHAYDKADETVWGSPQSVRGFSNLQHVVHRQSLCVAPHSSSDRDTRDDDNITFFLVSRILEKEKQAFPR